MEEHVLRLGLSSLPYRLKITHHNNLQDNLGLSSSIRLLFLILPHGLPISIEIKSKYK